MRITKASAKAIKYACLHFHYSRTVPAVQHGYNVYNDNDEWCGCVLYGGGANSSLSKSFGMNVGEVFELVRVALNGKQEQTSKAVALSLKQLHKDNPLVKLVVSYADHRQKHLGTIYQATNWIYLGLSITSDKQYLINGKWTHVRSLYHLKNKEEMKKTLPSRENSNKFKYIYVFDKKERKKYKSLPYPKDKDLTECEMQVEKKRLTNNK